MRLLPRRAESLIESMIAITVITLSTTAALVLMQTAIVGNRVIAEKVVALNLALEGVEAVKNIRDTNYLNFASNPEDCWNAIDATSVSDCAAGTRMADGDTYYLKRELRTDEQRLKWELESSPAALEYITHYKVYNLTSTGTRGTDIVTELYAQSGLEAVTVEYEAIEEDVFTRVVTFTANSYAPDDSIDVTVTIGWESKGNNYDVSLTRTIANVY
jgi:hypothetical protein